MLSHFPKTNGDVSAIDTFLRTDADAVREVSGEIRPSGMPTDFINLSISREMKSNNTIPIITFKTF